MTKINFKNKFINVKAVPYADEKDIPEIFDFLEELRKLEKKYYKHNMDKINKWLHEEDN